MPYNTATAVACANIALIKYWGNQDETDHIPSSGSISINLAGLETTAKVAFNSDLKRDILIFNNHEETGERLGRVSRFLDNFRTLAGINYYARIESSNNFPTGVGIASSASAFAALAVATTHASGLDLTEKELSRLARKGSGSACRSIPTGFVEWLPGRGDDDSYAISIAKPEHWDLVDCIAVVSTEPKRTSSLEGHGLASTSPLQAARVSDSPRRLKVCRDALLTKDFDQLAAITEMDSTLMHAVMMTSTPSIFYWEPSSLALIKQVPTWRKAGIPVCYTLDAGPNVHLITTSAYTSQVQEHLSDLPGLIEIFTAGVGQGAKLW